MPKKGNTTSVANSSGDDNSEQGLDFILSLLSGVVPAGDDGYKAVCPSHDDGSPSLSVTRKHDNSGRRRTFLDCKNGCSFTDVVNELGLRKTQMFEPGELGSGAAERRGRARIRTAAPSTRKGAAVARYPYEGPGGATLYTQVRYDPKDFRTDPPGYPADERVPFRLPQLIAGIEAGRTIWVVEGEKDVLALEQAGEVATCNPGGALAWHSRYARWFDGADIRIVRDKDDAGTKFVLSVAATLAGVAKSVQAFEPATPQDHSDVSDHLEAGYRLDQLLPLDLSQLEHDQQAAQSASLFEKHPALDWSEVLDPKLHAEVDWLPGRFMARGQQVSLVGDGKSGKSLLVLEWIWRALLKEPFLGDEETRPMRVIYFDRENTKRDLFTRLVGFGATTRDVPLLQEHIRYQSFPSLASLDESRDAAAEMVSLASAHRADVVVLDTASRFVGGKENESDTWLDLYRNLHVALKAQDVACVRLDHFGKDKDRGGRGSSAKTQDVDHVWELRAEKAVHFDAPDGNHEFATALTMARTHTRSGEGADEFLMIRVGAQGPDRSWLAGRTSTTLRDVEQDQQQATADRSSQMDRSILATVLAITEQGDHASSRNLESAVTGKAVDIRARVKELGSLGFLTVRRGDIKLTDTGREALEGSVS